MVSTVGRQVIMPMVVGGHAAGRYLFKSYDGVARTKTQAPCLSGRPVCGRHTHGANSVYVVAPLWAPRVGRAAPCSRAVPDSPSAARATGSLGPRRVQVRPARCVAAGHVRLPSDDATHLPPTTRTGRARARSAINRVTRRRPPVRIPTTVPPPQNHVHVCVRLHLCTLGRRCEHKQASQNGPFACWVAV